MTTPNFANVAKDRLGGEPHMLEIQRRQLLVDGEPRLLVGGEVHYFRVAARRVGRTACAR